VTFSAEFPGFEADSFAVEGEAPIDRIELSAKDGELRCEAHVSGAPSKKEAKELAGEQTERVLDRLAILLNTGIGSLRQRSSSLSASSIDEGGIERHSTSGSTTWCGIPRRPPVQRLDVSTIEHLRRDLQHTQSDAARTLLSQFRVAASQRDPVARFIFLYSILLFLRGDTQKNVDEFVRTNEPDVTESPSPRHEGGTETIYTRLRNELAHRRENADPKQTIQEVKDVVAGLQALARTAIGSQAGATLDLDRGHASSVGDES